MMTEEQRAEQAVKGMKTFIATMESLAKTLNHTFRVSNSDTECVNFFLDDYEFTLSWSEEQKQGIGRVNTVVEYQLSIWKDTPSSYCHPPESVDVTLASTQSINQCVRKAFELVKSERIRIALESYDYNQMAKEEAMNALDN